MTTTDRILEYFENATAKSCRAAGLDPRVAVDSILGKTTPMSASPTKTWRVYYNRSEDFPQVWSVDEGASDSEICVCAVYMEGCPRVSTQYNPLAEKEPRAWIEVTADALEIRKGAAWFTATESNDAAPVVRSVCGLCYDPAKEVKFLRVGIPLCERCANHPGFAVGLTPVARPAHQAASPQQPEVPLPLRPDSHLGEKERD